MFDPNNLKPDAREYFNAMSEALKENIAQSGMGFTTLEELKAYERSQLNEPLSFTKGK